MKKKRNSTIEERLQTTLNNEIRKRCFYNENEDEIQRTERKYDSCMQIRSIQTGRRIHELSREVNNHYRKDMEKMEENYYDDKMWSVIEEFPDYAVSRYGKIKNVNTNRIISTHYNQHGCEIVKLRKYKKQYTRSIKRLQANAFGDHYYFIDDPKFTKGGRVINVNSGVIYNNIDECAKALDANPQLILLCILDNIPFDGWHALEFYD